MIDASVAYSAQFCTHLYYPVLINTIRAPAPYKALLTACGSLICLECVKIVELLNELQQFSDAPLKPQIAPLV